MWILIALLMAIPITVAFWPAVTAPSAPQALIAIATSREFLTVLRFTLSEALVSAALSTVLAVPAAYLLYVRTGRRGWLASVVRNAVMIPFVLPGILVVLSMMVLYGRSGYVSQCLAVGPWPRYRDGLTFLYGYWGIILVHVFYNVSLGIRMVGTAWERLDARVMDASRTLGASRIASLATVAVPLLSPSIWYSFLLTFIYSSLSFTPVLVFGGGLLKTVEVAIYGELNTRLDFLRAGQLALLQTLMLLVLVAAGAMARRRLGRYSTAFSGARPTATPGGISIPGALYIGSLAVFSMGPLIALFARSLSQAYPGASRISGYGTILLGHDLGSLGVSAYGVALTSAAIGLCTALIVTLLAYGVAIGLRGGRRRRGSSAFREMALLLPVTVSPLSLGLGSLRVMSGLPAVTGVILFQVLMAFPVVYSLVQVGVDSLDQRVTEAAQVLGARGFSLTRTIRVPLLRGTLIAALSYGFAVSIGDFAGVLLLGRGEIVTFPVAIYRLMGHYNFPQATALGVVLATLTTALFLLTDRYSVRGVRGGLDAAAE